MALKVNYKDDQLNVSQNTNRVFDLVDQNGQVVLSNLSLQDKTDYSQTGDNFGAADINATNTAVNKNTKNVSWYGTCSTAAATTAKVATTTDTAFALATGAKVKIKFTNANTASAPTLNVDSKGAKAIKAYGTTAPTSWWKAGDIVEFTYDGTNWIMGASQGEIEQINNNLTANTKKFQFAYDSTKQKYGYTIDGTFYPFSSGAIYLGEYSANTTIDVSALGATSADQFLITDSQATNGGTASGRFWEREYGAVGGNGKFTPPSVSLANDMLTLTVGILHLDATAYTTYGSNWENRASISYNTPVPCKVYFVGDIESAS